jgi:hypothetical protein
MPVYPKLKSKPKELKFTTIRDFTGGLNVVDNDLNLNSRFQTVSENMYLAEDGTLAVRFGTRHFRRLPIEDGIQIVGERYFANHIISVTSDGRVWRTNGQGTAFVIFDNTIAATLPGAPLAWDPTDYVTFSEFNGNLQINNGLNKPLRIHSDLFVEYLVDDATASNFFVPVARHSTTHGNFNVLSGDPFNPDVLFISSTGTIGTFEGAPNPNDGVNVILGNKVTRGSNVIRGHASFRDKLIVIFDQCIVIGTLGIYNSAGDHTPDFSDAIDQWGAQNHNTIQAFGDDMLFLDPFGAPSLARAIFTSEVSPERASELVDPGMHRVLRKLGDDALTRLTFAVYDPELKQFMCFIPNDPVEENVSETICFVQRIQKNKRERPWASFRGWNWRCGCTSANGRVFFAKGKDTYVMGTSEDAIFGDYNNQQDSWSDGTAFSDGTGFMIGGLIADYVGRTGIPIKFDGQTPWADFDKRMIGKHSKYISADTRGKSSFTLDMFVDNIYIDRANLGEEWTDGTLFSDDTGWIPLANIPYQPALSMDFVGAQFGGYGASGYGVQYGDGRPTSYEQLYGWPAKFNLAKLRVHGYDREELGIISISLAYNEGSIRR